MDFRALVLFGGAALATARDTSKRHSATIRAPCLDGLEASTSGDECECPADVSVSLDVENSAIRDGVKAFGGFGANNWLPKKGDHQGTYHVTVATVSKDVELELVELGSADQIGAKKVANAIRRATKSVWPSKKASLCKHYDRDGGFVSQYLEHTYRRSSIFVAKAVGGNLDVVLGVSALRGLSLDTCRNVYRSLKCDDVADVAEVNMVYVDPVFEGMSISSLTLSAVLEQARRWGIRELVLESSPTAHGMYQMKYGFVDFDEVDGSTHMSKKLIQGMSSATTASRSPPATVGLLLTGPLLLGLL